MHKTIRVAIIGLDSSHTIEFVKRMQAPECPPEQKVQHLQAVSCLRFTTPFQSESGLNARQQQLEAWGVKVTTDFTEAVTGCDALLLAINDPAYHLEYFSRCVDLGKNVFLDKPLADTLANGRKISALINAWNLKTFSASALRFVPQLETACQIIPSPSCTTVYGPLGLAPTGSSIIWYGVHTFEMLQRAMGRGAQRVFVRQDDAGLIAIISYAGGRRGIVELNQNVWIYGGCLRSTEQAAPFVVDTDRMYSDLLEKITNFFQGVPAPVAMEDTLEIMAMLEAAQHSLVSGKEEEI